MAFWAFCPVNKTKLALIGPRDEVGSEGQGAGLQGSRGTPAGSQGVNREV